MLLQPLGRPLREPRYKDRFRLWPFVKVLDRALSGNFFAKFLDIKNEHDLIVHVVDELKLRLKGDESLLALR